MFPLVGGESESEATADEFLGHGWMEKEEAMLGTTRVAKREKISLTLSLSLALSRSGGPSFALVLLFSWEGLER